MGPPTHGGRGEGKTQIVVVGVSDDSGRVFVWERQIDSIYLAQPASSGSIGNPSVGRKGLALADSYIQQELAQRGDSQQVGGYDAKLIGWLEIEIRSPKTASKIASNPTRLGSERVVAA